MIHWNVVRWAARGLAALAVAWVTMAASAAAQPAPDSARPASLNAAESFAVLGRTAVSNTGASAVTGDVGAGLMGAITGFPPGTIAAGGLSHQGDAVAVQALMDAEDVFDHLQHLECRSANNLTGQN